MQISMGIIKLEVNLPEVVQAVDKFRKNRIKALETITTEIKAAVSSAFNQLLQREQIDPRLKEDMAILHLAGISTRTLSMISRRILGVEISPDTVSKSLHVVEEKGL